jgi:hypothetical protein
MLDLIANYVGGAATLALPAVLAYFFGRRKKEHERLYEQKARVIADLFDRYEKVDQRFHSLVSPIDWAGEPSKQEKARMAAESFNELNSYFRSNSIWLSRQTSLQVQEFLQRYRKTFHDFRGTDPNYPYMPDEWPAIWKRFEKESPEIRAALEEEFRASLGDVRAKLSRLQRRRRLSGSRNKSAIEPPDQPAD